MIIAIDPGLTGAACAYWSPDKIQLYDVHHIGKEVDVIKLHRWLNDNPTAHVFIEQLGIRPRQAGVQTMIRNWQRLEDAAILAGLPLEIVPPKRWQTGIVPATCHGDRKATIAAYCNYARKKYPMAELIPKGKRVIQDGRAAALCIADWAWRKRI